MTSSIKRRIAVLEQSPPPPGAKFRAPLVIQYRDDQETEDEAILRVCGPAGLPPVRPGDCPTLIVSYVTARFEPGDDPDEPEDIGDDE